MNPVFAGGDFQLLSLFLERLWKGPEGSVKLGPFILLFSFIPGDFR
jgi:hypothetical protein